MPSKARSRPRTATAPPRKPMAIARRVSLFEREIRVRLSSAALEILFDAASLLSEGQVEGDAFFGSTMITIDLTRAGPRVSDPCDEPSARRVADLIAADERVLDRARSLAFREALRLAGCALRDAQIDLHARYSGVHLHLDMDIEATVQESA